MSRPGCDYLNSPDPDVVSVFVQQRYVTSCALTVDRARWMWLDGERAYGGSPVRAVGGFPLDSVAFTQVSQVESGALAVGYSGTALAVAGGRGRGEAW